jgi:copper transport protein
VTAGRGRPWSRLAVLVVLLLIGLVAGTGTASAHAGLIGSDPPDGVVLDAAPSTMTLQFNEGVVVDQTSIEITEVGSGASTSVDSDPGARSEESTVTFALPQLPKGAYEVTWTTVSGSDRHTSTGVVVFGIGTPPPAAAATDPWPTARDAVPRSLGLVGLTVSLGAVAVLLLATFRLSAGDAASTLQRRTASVGVVAAVMALLGDVGLLVTALGSTTWTQLLTDTTFGQRWIISFAATAALAVVLVLAGRVRTRALYWVAAAVGALAVAVQPLDTHLAAGSAAAFGTLAAAVHLAAAGAWAGGLVVLVLVWLVAALRHEGREQYLAVRTMFAGFAWLALPAAALLAITGLLLTGRQVATPDALLFTHYGRILLVKIALVAVIGGLGLRHALHFHRRDASDQPRRTPRTVVLEASLFVVVLGAAALLGGASPPRGAPWVVPPAPAVPIPVSDQVDDLAMTVSVSPGIVGPNVLAVLAFQTRRPSPGPVLLVTATVTDADGNANRLTLSPAGVEGRWRTALDLSAPGKYTVAVSAARAGLPDATLSTTWTVANPPAVARAVDVSNAALESPLRWLAFALMLAIAVVVAIVLALRDSVRRAA